MLRLTGVGYRYAGYPTPVLHDVTLELAPGEIVGLVGANEAGKSTVCLVASGLAPGSIGGELTSGDVEIDGRSTKGRPLHEIATAVGICFQNPATQLSGVAGSVFEEVASDPVIAGFGEYGAQGQPLPNIPAMNSVWGDYGNAQRDILLGAGDPETLVTDAATRIREAIAAGG